MSTSYPDLFAALAAPFSSNEVKFKPAGNRKVAFITARHVMNRLDNVLGPENWWDTYTPAEKSVLCKLTIRLPDGSTLTKADAGGYAGMADEGDDDKSGYSDSFKRAAVKFGIARELYGDGVANFRQSAPAPRQAAHLPSTPASRPAPPPTANGHGPAEGAPKPAPKPDHRPLAKFIADGVDHYVGKFLAKHPDAKPPVNSPDVSRHVIRFATEKGYIPDPGAPNEGQIAKLLAGLSGFDEVKQPLQDAAVDYIRREIAKAEERIRLEEHGDPDLDEAGAGGTQSGRGAARGGVPS
jgi:hypothetical protein